MRKMVRTMALTASAMLLFGASALAAEPIKVQVNGQPITFADAQPEAKEGRTYIPMRATFNALGFEDESIAWDSATSTVTAKRGDLEISLKLGEKKVTVTEAGETRTVETDAAAYAANSRTYVPVRVVAEAAGCNVGWDNDDRTVLIDDVDALLAANTETYTIMEKYVEYGKSLSSDNVAMKGDVAMTMAMAEVADVKVDGKYDAVASDTAVQMTMDLNMVASAEDVPAETMKIDADVRGDMETGVFYFKSDALSEMMGATNIWFKMDMNEMMSSDEMTAALGGMNYADLLKLSKDSQKMGFSESLAAVLKAIPLTDKDMTAKQVLDMVNALVGDSAFEKQENTYMSETEIEGAKLTIALPTSGEKVTGISILVSAEGQDVMKITMQGSKLQMTMNFSDDELGMALEMTMNATYSKASKAPVTEPPAGASVMDLSAMMDLEEAA